MKYQNRYSIALLATTWLGLSTIGPTLVSPASATTPPTISGNWQLQSFGSPDAPTAVLPDTSITANFAEGTLSGRAGCNTYRGSYTTQARRLTIAPLATSRKLCPPAVMAQEAAFLTALQTAKKYRINDQGQLQLRYKTDDGVQLLTFNPPTPALNSTAWKVVDWTDQPNYPLPNTTVTLTFSDNGRANGSSGCNFFLATYQITGNTLMIERLATTLRACFGDVAQQEAQYLNALQTISRYQINDHGQLQIVYADGARTITFDPQ
jgi:heat shock protein HslJ